MLGRTGGVMRQTVPSWAKASSEPGCMVLECRLGNAKYANCDSQMDTSERKNFPPR
jgi:hypothetical protein